MNIKLNELPLMLKAYKKLLVSLRNLASLNLKLIELFVMLYRRPYLLCLFWSSVPPTTFLLIEYRASGPDADRYCCQTT